MDGEDQDTVTLTGGAAAGAQVPQEGNGGCIPGKPPILGDTDVDVGSPYTSAGSVPETGPIPTEPPTFRDVEIGGGRITGYETPAGGTERQFAMYNANQYMAPTGPYETVQTVDGESWYKQYAQPTVQRTPYKEESGKIGYNEQIVDQLPQIPKRKDRV